MIYSSYLNDNIVEAFKVGYDKYITMFDDGSKLIYVKQLKEDCGLGLRDAKDSIDLVINGGKELFVDTFGIKRIRKEKLRVLTHKLLTEDLLSKFKDCDETKLKEILFDLDIDVIEEILDKFLEHGN